MKLVIVESPGKIKKIQSILGSGYEVVASYGHVCDLPLKELGFDKSTMEEHYVVSQQSRKTISSLKKKASIASEVFLATDLDREGEAIAWHLIRELSLKRFQRIVFSEITNKAIHHAIANPIKLDHAKVEAQRTRRVLDRAVGYLISPAINKSITSKSYLSVGRVQSVALRLVAEREGDITSFRSEEHYGVEAIFSTSGITWSAFWDHKPFLSSLIDESSPLGSEGAITLADIERESDNENALLFKYKQHAQQLTDLVNNNPSFDIIDIEISNASEKAKDPFKTSTLQQAASINLKWKVDKTMKVAQALYEAGYITYMRTDSTVIAEDFVNEIRQFISKWQEAQSLSGYLPVRPIVYSNTSDNAQEAHEAIRPTSIMEMGKSIEDEDQKALYLLIWKQALASQMAPATYELTKVFLELNEPYINNKQAFIAKGKVVLFDGWRRVVKIDMTNEDEAANQEGAKPNSTSQSLPPLAVKSSINAQDAQLLVKHTKPPARFTEASLVKRLEALGIGRPATYASIMKTLFSRKYIVEVKRKLEATPLGMMLVDKLVGNFDFIKVDYTKQIEAQIDEIVEGKLSRQKVLRAQSGVINSELISWSQNNPDVKPPAEEVESEYTCPVCKNYTLMIRTKRNSSDKFYSCAGYPKCKAIFDINAPQSKLLGRTDYSQHPCPDCGASKLELRKGQYGDYFHCDACGKNNKCNDGKPQKNPNLTDNKCPSCYEGKLTKRTAAHPKKGKSPIFYGCTNYPKCRHAQDEI